MTRWFSAASVFIGLCFMTTMSNAGQLSATNEPQSQSTSPNIDAYRGYVSDLTQVTGQQNLETLLGALHRQIDIVEGVGLSDRLRRAFRTVPILIDDLACLETTREQAQTNQVNHWACYGSFPKNTFQGKSIVESRLWQNSDENNKSALTQEGSDLVNSDTVGRGLIMVRPSPLTFGATIQEPFLLHELLHFYHLRMLPDGDQYEPIMVNYEAAKSGKRYPAEEYVLTNEKEYFAVTASIFLYGKSDHAPFTRGLLKDAQPDYYKFLVGLFGFDPSMRAPIASAD